MRTVTATLLSLLGLAVTLIGYLVMPRILGQIVPVAQVTEVRAQSATELAEARATATTWKEAFEGMRQAHDSLLALQREQQQAVMITNTVMTALKAQLPTPPPSASSSAVTGG
jgi:hypothetical protein